MGGYGSGRWGYHTARPVAESSLAWPITHLRKAIRQVRAIAHSEWTGTIHWLRGGREVAACGYTLTRQAGGLVVTLVYRRNDVVVRETIPLVTTGSNLPGNAGLRWWWQCPRCARRVGVLYAPTGYWRCRHCHDITYRSSNESDSRVSKVLMASIPPEAAPAPDASADVLTRARWADASASTLILYMKAFDAADRRYRRALRRDLKAVRRRKRRT